MNEMPENLITKLFFDMKSDLDQWSSEEEIDFAGRYGAAIQSMGAIPFLTEAFRRFEGSTLLAYLGAATFVWKDLPFSAWKEVLHRISDSSQAVYQYVRFTSPFLGIDILSMIRTDPNVHDNARELITLDFPNGAPRGGTWEREILENSGVDPVAMWRRLASEGAPMKMDVSQLQ